MNAGEPQSVQNFLESKSDAGLFDSPGQFTVAADKASIKLAESSLERKEHWVLKAVQAAVRGGFQRLEFRFQRDSVRLDFFGECISFDNVKAALKRPGLGVGPFWAEMLVGLRALIPSQTFQVQQSDGNGLSWDGTSLSQGGRSPRLRGTLTLWVSSYTLNEGRPRLLWDPSLARRTQEYVELLQRRASYAPLELIVDGRRVVPDEAHRMERPAPKSGVQTGLVRLLSAALPAQRSLEEVGSELVKAPERILCDPLRSEAAFLGTPSQPRNPGDRWISLFALTRSVSNSKEKKPQLSCVPGRFFLHFTRYGVICQSWLGRATLGGALHWPADHETADLSGLAIRLTEETRRQAVRFLQSSSPLTDALRDAIAKHVPRRHIGKKALEGAGFFGTVTGGTWSTVFLIAGKAIVGLKSGLWIGAAFGAFFFGLGVEPRVGKRLLFEAINNFDRASVYDLCQVDLNQVDESDLGR